MSFAALQDRLNASVLKHLANVSALVDGQAVSGIFTDAYASGGPGMGMADSQPALRLLTSDVAPGIVGKEVQIGSTTFTVAASQPDGAGMTLLMLEDA